MTNMEKVRELTNELMALLKASEIEYVRKGGPAKAKELREKIRELEDEILK